MHDTITAASLLENGPLVASYLWTRAAHIRYANNKMGGAWLSMIELPNRLVWVWPRSQALRKMGEECLVSNVHASPWFSGNVVHAVRVAQPYIIESRESIGTRLATVQVWNVKLSQSSTVYSKYSFTISVHISRVDTISNQISKSVLFAFFKWGTTGHWEPLVTTGNYWEPMGTTGNHQEPRVT